MAVALTMRAVAADMSVRFWQTAQLVLELGNAKRKGTLSKLLNDVSPARLLVLDEFVYVPCDVCKGRRYNRETLEVRYKGRNIAEVLDMTAREALDFFSAVPKIYEKLQTLCDVGLGYVKLGQSSTTLSGGEAQRVKLATELSRRATGRTFYILDEPTTGLHSDDVKKLLEVLQRLVDAGNTVLVIEHNLDVIKSADWLIDLGPEGGAGGGTLVCAGTPETVAACEASYTGQYLKKYLF